MGEVRFRLSGVEFGAAFLEPWEVVFQAPAEAAEGDILSIQAEAVDTSGNAAAAEGTITVAAAPDTEPPFGVTLDGPAEAIAGRPLALTAAASDDTGVLKATFFADGVEIAADPDSPYRAVYAVPASHVVGTRIRLAARAVDFAGNTADSDPLLVRVVAPGAGEISGRVYDDTIGLPVENAAVALVSVHGEAPADILEVYTDARGAYRIPAPEGAAVLRIDAPNTTAAWRAVSVKPGRVVPAYDARLTPLAEGVPVDHLAGADLTHDDLAADLEIPAGAFGEDVAPTLTRLSEQGLPGPLPFGWRPVSALHVGPDAHPLNAPLTLRLRGPDHLDDPDTAPIPVLWDPDETVWRRIPSDFAGTEITLYPARTGALALVRPDTEPSAPPTPAVGEALTGAAAAALSAGSAAEILPDPEILFMRPGVRSDVRAVLAGPEPLPSGARIAVDIAEHYDRIDGARTSPAPMTQEIVLYRRRDGLSGRFFVSPSLNFDPAQLSQGLIRLTARRPADAPASAKIGPDGGALSLASGLSVAFPAGALAGDALVSLEPLENLPAALAEDSRFTATGETAGVFVDLGGAAPAPGAVLETALSAAPSADDTFLLVRPVTLNGRARFESVSVASVDGAALRFDGAGLGFPGIGETGRYFILKLSDPAGFVAGVLTDGAGPAPDALAETEELPFIGRTGADGRYVLAALLGEAAVRGWNPATGESASGTANLAAAGEIVSLDLFLESVRPSVLSIAPEADAAGVPLTAAVTAVFSEAIDPETLAGVHFQVLDGGDPVPGAVAPLSDGRTAVFRPAELLADGADYTIEITDGVADIHGNALIPFTSVFSTVDTTPPPRPEAGQITVPIPDDTGAATVTATQGAVEPGTVVTIIVVQDGTEVRTTVIAEEDGSFAAAVEAGVADDLALEFMDEAGNISTYDPGPFRDSDGTAVIGVEGGTLRGVDPDTGDWDGAEIVVPEGVVPDGTVVKVAAETEDALPLPVDDFFDCLGVIDLEMGDVVAAEELKASIPAPEGAALDEDSQVLVFQVVDFFGAPAFTLVNVAHWKETEDGPRLETASPPFPGLLMSGQYAFAAPSDPVVCGTVIPSAWLKNVRISADAGFRLVDHPKLPGYKTIIAVPANHSFTVTAFGLDGAPAGDPKIFEAPDEPFAKLLIPAPEDAEGVPDLAEVLVGADDEESAEILEDVPTSGVDVGGSAAATFTKQIVEVGDENLILERIDEDGTATRVSGAVTPRTADVNGAEILQGAVFTPDVRLKYGAEYRLTVRDLVDFSGRNMPSAAVRAFRTFRPRAIGGADVAHPSGVSALGADPERPRLAVANGALHDPDPNSRGIVLLDVTDPSEPLFLREEPILGDTFGVLALDDAAAADGPAVLGIGGGTGDFGTLRIFGIGGENLDEFELVGFKFLSIPAGYAEEGYVKMGVPRHSGLPWSLSMLGNDDVYISMIGIGVLGVNLHEAVSQHQGDSANELPGKFVMNAPVAAVPANGALLVGDMRRLVAISLDLSRELKTFEDIPARAVAAGDGFPVGFDESGTAVLKDLAFVGGTDGVLTVLDMEIPENPTILSQIRIGGSIRAIRPDPRNRLVYASNGQTVAVVDADGLDEPDEDRDRVLGTVEGLDGAGDLDIRDGFGYVADPGGGKVHSVLLGCPEDRVMYIESGEYPVPPGGSVVLKTEPAMKTKWEIVEYGKGLDEKSVSIDADTGALTVEESAVAGYVRVRAVNQDIAGCDVTAKVRVCACACVNCEGKAEVVLDGVDIRVNLGPAAGGHAAGELLLQAGTVSEELADPAFLEHSILGRDVNAVYDEDGTIQSIDTGRIVAEVVPKNEGYEIQFKTKGDQTPFVVYRLETTGPENDRRFRFTENRNAQTVRSVAYAAEGDGGMRMLRLDETGETVQEEILEKTTDGDTETRVRTVIEDGLPVSVTETVYEETETGSRVVRETVDPGGLNLTTLSEYYTDPGDPGHGRLKTRARPDGSSTAYAYDDRGRVASKSRHFMDTPDGRATEYDYAPLPGDADRPEDVRIPRTVAEKIGGTVVSRTFSVFARDADGGRVEIAERAASPSAAYGDPANLRTVRTYHPHGREFTSGRLKSAVHPDGRLDTHTYVQGTYVGSGGASPGNFVAGTGDDVRESAVRGTVDRPAGVAYKTTKDVVVADRAGHVLQTESHVYTGLGYERIEWTVRVLDRQGRPETEYRSDGTTTETVWGCCNREQTTDARGLTTFFGYDGLDRIAHESRESLKGVIRTDYDRAVTGTGRVETRTVTGGGLSLSSVARYDLAGRTLSTTNAAGLTTEYEYAEAGRITTVVHPGGATEITERYLDGRTKRTTGTAAVDRFYEYGVNADGTRWTRVYTGSADASSPMWEKTTTDFLGRTIRTEKPAFGGGVEIAENEYDGKGRLFRSIAPGRADTLYEYDELGNQVRSGLDADGNGELDPASADRITESDTVYARVGAAWWRQSVQTVYAETGDGTATPAGTRRTRITGLGASAEHGILTGESVSVDIHGNQTVQKSYLDRIAKTETRVVDSPDSEIDAVSVSEMGLLVSSTGKTGITVTYDYDTLAQRTHVIDPRTGAAVTAYNAKGQVESVTDPAQHTTEFIYDPTTGRKIAERNALNRYTRYAYDDRGQVTRTWGDTAYPVKYVYDEAGRLTEMHTFREGENWSGETWPSGNEGAADVTRWRYDAATGLLESKEYADGTATVYDYEIGGRLDTRTWARTVEGAPLVTDYDYDSATGELTLIDYSDAATPDITFAYDRLGRRETVTDAAGTRAFAYNDALQLESETVQGGGIYGSDPVTLTRTYEDESGVPGRNGGFTLDAGYAVTYGHDAATGRFGGVDWTAGGESGAVDYAYAPDSDLLAGYSSESGVGVSYSYEPLRNLKTRVENSWGGASLISQYDYRYDELGRRSDAVETGAAFSASGMNLYDYNDRSEVVSSERYASENPDAPGAPATEENRSYEYDPIGNREESVAGVQQAAIYETNVLNQYTNIAGGKTAAPAYDDDGNMTAYKNAVYSWNAENRLVSVETDDKKVAFLYDYMGRRVRKRVYAGSPGAWSLESEKRFVYDGWNLVREIAVSGGSDKYFVWGPRRHSKKSSGQENGYPYFLISSLTFPKTSFEIKRPCFFVKSSKNSRLCSLVTFWFRKADKISPIVPITCNPIRLAFLRAAKSSKRTKSAFRSKAKTMTSNSPSCKRPRAPITNFRPGNDTSIT